MKKSEPKFKVGDKLKYKHQRFEIAAILSESHEYLVYDKAVNGGVSRFEVDYFEEGVEYLTPLELAML